MKWFFRQFARLPLGWIHALGAALGWLVYWSSAAYAARMRENIAASGLCAGPEECRRLLRRAVPEAGKSVLELTAVWLRPYQDVLQLAHRVEGWEQAMELSRGGRGIMFLTPHVGCFEIFGPFLSSKGPVAILYRPSKLAWTESSIVAGRGRGQATLAPAGLKGVRTLLKSLKQGHFAAILPDQVPGSGDGVWADFFGRPAYTMTLVQRLQQATGAAIVLMYAERLPGGRGYDLRFDPVAEDLPPDPGDAARALNAMMEDLVRRNPAQYLWSYNRYKQPRGAKLEAEAA